MARKQEKGSEESRGDKKGVRALNYGKHEVALGEEIKKRR